MAGGSLKDGTLAVVGVGLMGGSLGSPRAARGARGPRVSRSQETLDLALERGAITAACSSIEEAAAAADLVVVATPVRLVGEHVRADLAAVVLLEPGDDDRGVEAPRVGEGGLPDLRRAHAAPSFSVSSRAVTKADRAAFGMT